MCAHNELDDVQTQPATARLAGQPPVYLAEPSKDALLFLRGDPNSVIRNRENHMTAFRCGAHGNALLARSVFAGVVQQIQ
jgi:predicted metal-dependent RNase